MLSGLVKENSQPAYSSRTPCPLCAETGAFLLSRSARDGSSLTTILCKNCGLARTDPMPSELELAAYYRDEYRSDYKGVIVPKKKHVLRAARLARQRLALLAPWLQPGASILDLGAGGGEFVYLARSAGFQARGIEPNTGYANYACHSLGLDIAAGTWQTQQIASSTLDAVTLFHVLEHLPDPLACLRELHRWLRTDGILLVEVPHLLPNAGNPHNRFHRAHLVHFTLDTLTTAFRLAGFEVLWCKMSSDDGNILVAGKKPARAIETPLALANPQAVARVLRWERTRPRHPYLHPSAWLRFLRKASNTLGEVFAAARYRQRQQILAAVASQPMPAHSALSSFWRSATIRP